MTNRTARGGSTYKRGKSTDTIIMETGLPEVNLLTQQNRTARDRSAETTKVETGLRGGYDDTTKLRGGSTDTTKVETGLRSVDLPTRHKWRQNYNR